MELAQLIFLGLGVGLLSSFFGIGGGSLIVPVMYGLYPQLPPSIVIPISLGSIFIIVCGNVYKFSKQDLLPKKDIILNFVTFCSIGSFAGSQVVYLIDTSMAKMSMGVILIFMIIKLLLPSKKLTEENKNYVPQNIPFALTGLMGAFISSITGFGGGIIFTPVFMNVLKVPSKLVSPYSNLAMLITTLIGVIPHLFSTPIATVFFNYPWLNDCFVGYVNFGIIGIIALSAYGTSSLGVVLNSKVSPQVKKYLLSFLLCLFSIKLLFY